MLPCIRFERSKTTLVAGSDAFPSPKKLFLRQASNLVFLTVSSSLLLGDPAHKGERLLDIAVRKAALVFT